MEKQLKEIIEYAVSKGWEERWSLDCCKELIDSKHYYTIIFSEPFLKAYFGEGEADEQYNEVNKYWHDTSCCSGSGCFFHGKRWQYHAQNLVLLPDKEKIEYLYKHLK